MDHFSFEDSDRFEEDSLCSWSSEPESVCNNWRGWKKPIGYGIANGLSSNSSATSTSSRKSGENTEVSSLTELAAKCVASHIPFELVEHVYPPVPEQLQLRIAFWSFPDNEEDIRLYSCLANSSADEFNRGEQLFKNHAVKDPLQIGFHLSATVFSLNPRGNFKVAVTFDRRRISSCNCTCESSAYWCSHVVAVCLHRIHCPSEVCLRAPVSESLTRLQRDQLQKFAQYLISELPQQILPTAQRLLDELLSAQPTAINTVCGAPDPTAGASINDQTSWYLDEKTLHDNIKRIIVKFCIPAPIVFSDVNYLTNSAPPAAAEWSSLLRPLRGREPEGMWNLLSIVREMYRRCDRNAVRLLEIITEQCLACDQILSWWFQTKLSLMMGSHGHNGGKHSNTHSNSTALQHACSSLCDEIVVLWRLAALNPGLAPDERDMLHAQFTEWHLKILDRVVKCRMMPSSYSNKHQQNSRTDAELFVGFKPAIEACYLDWEDYPITGVTHTNETNPIYYSPFTCFKHTDSSRNDTATGATGTGQLNSTQPAIMSHKHYSYISSSGEHGMHGIFKQRFERPMRERFYISSSNNSSNSSSDSVHARVNQGLSGGVEGGGNGGMAGVNLGASGSSGSSALAAALTASKNHLETERPSVSGINMPVAAAVNAANLDGNRSSTSSEGFCENDDFGGDSSSNNLCSDGGGHTLEPSAMSVKKILQTSDSQCSFEVSTPDAEADADVEIDLTDDVLTEANVAEFKISLTPTNLPDYQAVGVSTATSALSSESSSSASITSSNAPIVALEAIRRLSKDDSFSSCASGDEDAAGPRVLPPTSTAGIDDQLDLDVMPSTSAAAALVKENHTNSPMQQCVAKEGILNVIEPDNSITLPANVASSCSNATAGTATTQAAEKPHVFSNVRPTEDAWDILLARAEGLHAHGHGREACKLAVRLAEEMLANPPNLMVELPPLPKRKGKNKNINPISHHLTVLASATLSKCAFLCTVLSENSKHHHIGFRICLFALEMPRPPASTKPLEVKLANQEADILGLLKKIPLNEPELHIIRDRAERLRSGILKSRGEALLPINLATFIFDALVMPLLTVKDQRNRMMSMLYRLPSDENLGFEAAVAALGLKANVSEAEHPLLCEGTRRQRGDLALTLLYYYKDEPRKIAKIMEKLLDREIHTLLKLPLLPAYYSNNPPVRTPNSTARREEQEYANGYGGHGGHGGHGSCGGMQQNASNMNEMLLSDYNSSVGGNSRPHSSTSAELDVGMSALNINSAQNAQQNNANNNGQSGGMPSGMQTATTGQTNVSRAKDSSRYKGKRAYPSIPNQPSEASAHFMFELAKNVLTKAGGNSSTSLFTQASTNQNHHGPHRALHMCAFQLGLYALGLHNCVSPNWLSRTYSSHVSWIIGQAMEIGAPAISFLIDTWEGHLTPPEVASMADRASRGWDSYMIYPAAELALSVLPHAAALNPNEITRAILQCKEQSDHMLERACITVENAAKGGGVYPEVLFQVARYWYEMYLRNSPNSEHEQQHDDHHMLDHSAASLSALLEQQQQHHDMQMSQVGAAAPPTGMVVPGAQGMQNVGGPVAAVAAPTQQQPGQVVVTTAPPSFQQGVANMPPLGLQPYHHQPYSFCQSIYHHHNLSYPAANQMQMYISTAPPATYASYVSATPGNNQVPPNGGPPPGVANVAPQMHQSFVHQTQSAGVNYQQLQQQLPPQAYQAIPTVAPTQMAPPPNLQQAAAAAAAAAAAYYAQAPPPSAAATQMRHQQAQQNVYPFVQQPQQAAMAPVMPPPPAQPSVAQQPPPPVRQRHPHQYSQTQLRYLMAAYNVGMLAMETLARRVHDDRPQAKYARSPPYGEDVKWLLRISKKLGTQYLHQFCICAVNSIVSPFVLHDVAIEAAHFLGRNNHQLVMQHLRSALTPLVQKCQQMYIQCIHQKLYHLTQADYEEFATIILAARAAFQITPEGSAQFKDWLQSIRRSKSCKKELWAQINNALQSNSK